MKIKTNTFRALLGSLAFLCFFGTEAQLPFSTISTGLKHPAGVVTDASGLVWITESGNGASDGSVSVIRADGSKKPVVTGLPSQFDTATGDFIGPWHTLLTPDGGFAVVITNTSDKNKYAGSVLFFNVPGFVPGVSAPLTPAQNTRQLEVSKYLLGKGFGDTNPYSIALDDAGNLYVSDAGANAVVKYTPSGQPSVFVTLPDIKNPSPVGPPFINQVPTKIINRPGGGFYLATLTGFPFNQGLATIYTLSAAGVLTPFKTGFTMLTDLSVDPKSGDLFALQFGTFQFAPQPGYAPNSSKISRIKADGTTQVVAQNFGPGSGMTVTADAFVYATEINKGTLLRFDMASPRKTTLTVDMSAEKISPKGVYLAHDLNGWKANAVKMTAAGNGIYTADVVIPQGTTMRYKFVNGDSWGENESVPQACGEKNAFGFYDRAIASYGLTVIAGPVCFGACTQCGNRKPQSVYYYCPKGADVIYCENFEGFKYEKLVPQTSQWTTYALSALGTPLNKAADNPDVVGFWNGAVNFDGSRALRVHDYYPYVNSDDPIMYLGSPKTGRYQIDFKIYVPKGKSAAISVADTLNPNYEVFSLSFYKDLLTVYPDLFGAPAAKGPVAVKTNDWNDVTMIFNAATKLFTVSLNGQQAFSGAAPTQANFNFLEFWSNNPDNIAGIAEFYIDDIVYRRLPNTATLQQQTASADFGVYPNPANQTLTIAPQMKIDEVWQARIFNSLGQVVWSGKADNVSELRVETGDLQAGLYVVEIQTAAERRTTKIAVQH